MWIQFWPSIIQKFYLYYIYYFNFSLFSPAYKIEQKADKVTVNEESEEITEEVMNGDQMDLVKFIW